MKPTVHLEHCTDYNLENVQAALASSLRSSFPGIEEKFHQRRVLLKPNLVAAASYEEHATTHPSIVEGVVRWLIDLQAKPVIVESPPFGSLRRTLVKTGIQAVVDRYKIEAIELTHAANSHIQSHLTPHGLTIDRVVRDADALINLPKLKAHCQLLVTGATKNLYGLMPGKRKAWLHFKADRQLSTFCKMLLTNARVVRPTLHIVDAIIGMDTTGPRGGRPRQVGVFAVGDDPVAVDTVLCELINLPPDQYQLIRVARDLGGNTTRLAEIDLRGIPIDQLRVTDFRLPSQLMNISFEFPRLIQSFLRHVWLRTFGEFCSRQYAR